MKILYKIGLISIFLLWVVYFVTVIVLIVPGLIMRLFGVKFLRSYSWYFTGKLKGLKIDLQGWYMKRRIEYGGSELGFDGKGLEFGENKK